MTKRPPDSRVPFGQAIEDRLDMAGASMRRDTRKWLERQSRAAPGDIEMAGAMVGGIASALLDELNAHTRGDVEQMREAWGFFIDRYIGEQAEDAEADAESPAAEPQP